MGSIIFIFFTYYFTLRNKKGEYLFSKLFFLSSYWIIFEWGTIGRSYFLGIVLIILSLNILFQNSQNRYIFFFLVAGIATLSNGHSLIIVFSIVLSHFLFAYKKVKINANYYIGLAIFIPFFLISIYFMKGQMNSYEKSEVFQKELSKVSFSDKLSASFVYAGEGLFYLQRDVTDNQPIWQNNLFQNKYTMKKLMGYTIYTLILSLISFIIFLISICVLKNRNKQALLFFIFSFIALILVNSFSPIGISLRHKGFYFFILFITLFFCVEHKIFEKLVFLLFVFTTFSSIVILKQVSKKPFSNSDFCANYLVNTFDLNNKSTKIASHFWQLSSVIAYTNIKSVYIPEINQDVSFTLMDSSVSSNLSNTIHDSIFLNKSIENNCTIIIDNKKNDSLYKTKDFKLIAYFNKPSLQSYEKYFIYSNGKANLKFDTKKN